MSKEEIVVQMQKINQLSDEDQRYLYGECDRWCMDNFEEGLQIVAILEKDNHENGIAHCYIRNLDNGLCYDVRGESRCDEEIIAYTGVNYFSDNVEEYIFEDIESFKKFLKWIDFEIIRESYLAG